MVAEGVDRQHASPSDESLDGAASRDAEDERDRGAQERPTRRAPAQKRPVLSQPDTMKIRKMAKTKRMMPAKTVGGRFMGCS
jgi:hypothetical protein